MGDCGHQIAQADQKDLAKVRSRSFVGSTGLIGAFDTTTTTNGRPGSSTRRRAARNWPSTSPGIFYGVLFISLPRFAWKGKWIALLLGVIGADDILTLWTLSWR